MSILFALLAAATMGLINTTPQEKLFSQSFPGWTRTYSTLPGTHRDPSTSPRCQAKTFVLEGKFLTISRGRGWEVQAVVLRGSTAGYSINKVGEISPIFREQTKWVCRKPHLHSFPLSAAQQHPLKHQPARFGYMTPSLLLRQWGFHPKS